MQNFPSLINRKTLTSDSSGPHESSATNPKSADSPHKDSIKETNNSHFDDYTLPSSLNNTSGVQQIALSSIHFSI
jgi:hypothetical protein